MNLSALNESGLNCEIYREHYFVAELEDGWHIFDFLGIRHNSGSFETMDWAKRWLDDCLDTAAGKKVLS